MGKQTRKMNRTTMPHLHVKLPPDWFWGHLVGEEDLVRSFWGDEPAESERWDRLNQALLDIIKRRMLALLHEILSTGLSSGVSGISIEWTNLSKMNDLVAVRLLDVDDEQGLRLFMGRITDEGLPDSAATVAVFGSHDVERVQLTLGQLRNMVRRLFEAVTAEIELLPQAKLRVDGGEG